jgi:hypothetical protein
MINGDELHGTSTILRDQFLLLLRREEYDGQSVTTVAEAVDHPRAVDRSERMPGDGLINASNTYTPGTLI